MSKRQVITLGAEVLAVVGLASVPVAVNNSYALSLLTLLAIYGIVLVGLDISVGYLGQVNLAQAAFLGLGAYAAGLCAARLGFGMFPALAVAASVGCLFGGLLAFPALRLEGPQFALSTLSFMALTATVLNEWESLTGGAEGLLVSRPHLFGLVLGAKGFYWLCLVFFILVWIVMSNMLTSQWGRALEALRDSPIAADAMGIYTHHHKALAFALGSGLGGLAGGLYAFNFQYLQPDIFTWELMVVLLLGVVLGGRKSLWGAFVGAAIIVLLPNLLSNRLLFHLFSGIGFLLALGSGIRGLARKSVKPFQAIAPVVAMGLLVAGGILVKNTEDWRKAIFALMLFAIVVGLPEGLMGFASRFLERLFRIDQPPLPAPAPPDRVLPQRTVDGEPLLEVRDLKLYFDGIRALDGVSMTVRSGHIHGLIGPNGSGKSTLVNIISGLYRPAEGEVLLHGNPLPKGSLYRVSRHGIARTFQNLQLFTELTALGNVMVPMKNLYNNALPLALLGLTKNVDRLARADSMALLKMVGLEEQAHSRARDLPHGAQRFLEIARALARRPELLILDEPAAGLAHHDVSRLLDVIRRIQGYGITIILIEHHMEVVSGLCDVVTVLDYGKVIAEGPPDKVKRDRKVIEAYLGMESEQAFLNAGKAGIVSL